jgi:hypothetical protein
MEGIDAYLKTIEKWRGDAYQGPLGHGTGPEGDDIYQSIHGIRKLIAKGYGDYDKEVLEAQAKSAEGEPEDD